MIFSSEINSKIFRLCFSLLISGLVSCSSFGLVPSDSLIQRLRGRGAVLVSPDNPYLAGNLLLQQEAKKSKELAGFLSNKGQPQALLVEQKLLEAARVKLYYKDGLEQYEMELLRGVWVINGPSAIEDESIQKLVSGQLSGEDLEVLTPPGVKQSQTEAPQEQQAEMVSIFEEEPAKEPVSQNPEEQLVQPAEEINQAAEPAAEITVDQPEEEPEALAETTPRGDIVHYITAESESLSLISRWYTNGDLALSRVAKANNLPTNAVLSPGDQVIIPAELVRNKNRLTEHAVETLAD